MEQSGLHAFRHLPEFETRQLVLYGDGLFSFGKFRQRQCTYIIYPRETTFLANVVGLYHLFCPVINHIVHVLEHCYDENQSP